jgi:hypothetical protein
MARPVSLGWNATSAFPQHASDVEYDKIMHFSNLNVGCNWHFNVGIDSIAHECVASGTKNALIVGTPNSILSTGDQGVLVGTPIFNLEYW